MLIKIEEGLWGNIRLYYPAETPFNPYPNREFVINLIKKDFSNTYYFKNSGFLGHEPKDVAVKWHDMFSCVGCIGSKEKMINKMNEFIDWLTNKYK